MSKPIPAIQKHMTTQPHTFRVDETLMHAKQFMKEHQFRHLPVLEGGKLVGMLSSRDIAMIENLKDADLKVLKVQDAMSQEVYTVSPTSPLDSVVMEMAEHKYGSAVVMDQGHVVGIFTTVDVCKALGDLLNSRLAK